VTMRRATGCLREFRFMETLLRIIDDDVVDCSRFNSYWALGAPLVASLSASDDTRWAGFSTKSLWFI
jgi:hypothetical protein